MTGREDFPQLPNPRRSASEAYANARRRPLQSASFDESPWRSPIGESAGSPAQRNEKTPEADGSPSGPGPATMRNLAGFPGQENRQPRNAQPNNVRLPNGKLGMSPCTAPEPSADSGYLGSGSGWGLGLPMGGAPGLSNMQTRNVGSNSGLNSFAQSAGGPQASTSLDPS